jgi:DeoR family fructose operon transcriptional repressor
MLAADSIENKSIQNKTKISYPFFVRGKMPMYAAERQHNIMDLVQTNGRATVQELAETLNVTLATIRRDLSQLDTRGLLRRTHGGAVRVERLSFLTPVTNRAGQNDAEKDAIARAIVESLTDDSTIGIDAGTTTIKIAEAIPLERRLTVVTYSLIVASQLASHPNVRVHFLGGEIVENSRAAIGPWPLEMAGRVSLDTVYLSVDGVDAEFGLTTHNLHEAAVKSALMGSARRTVVVADHSKFGRAEFGRIGPIESADLIVSDAGVASTHLQTLRSRGVEVQIVPSTATNSLNTQP